MKHNVKKNDLAYITTPANELARGHFVEVLRMAAGNHEVDGVAFVAEDFDDGPPTWVVRGHNVPWGNGLANVFAISDACLRPVRGGSNDAEVGVIHGPNIETGLAA